MQQLLNFAAKLSKLTSKIFIFSEQQAHVFNKKLASKYGTSVNINIAFLNSERLYFNHQ